MRRLFLVAVLLAGTAVGLVWLANFDLGPLVINEEYEQKVILRFGNPVKVMTKPGWALRIPLVDSVRVFDRRLQYLSAEPAEVVIGQGDMLIVDYYVIWRIRDPVAFLSAFPSGMDGARNRIRRRIRALVGARVGELKMDELLARAEVLSKLAEESTRDLVSAGVQVLDVRLSRTELPQKAEDAIYAQMREQRRAIARSHRAQGERQARELRAVAERDAKAEIAAAKRDSERMRGRGDAKAARIYAAAYGRDPEFFAFFRSLQAYREGLGERTTLILSPDHEFFRFLGQLPRLEGAGEDTPLVR